MKHRTVVSGAIRFAVSAALILFLLHKVRFEELATALRGSHWWLFGLSTLILCARYLITGLRWQIILAAQGPRVPVARLVYWYFVSGFFNMFLPTVLGGDVVRIYQAGKSTGEMDRAAASVILERMIGFSGMIAITCVALCFLPPALRQPRIYVGVLGVVVCFTCALTVILNSVSCRWAAWTLRRLHLTTVAGKLEHGHARLRELTKERGALSYAFGLTLVVHSVGVFCVYLIGLALHTEVSFAYYCVAVPIIWLITMLPVSINGIGVREGGLVLFFANAGMSDADALLLSFLTFAQLVILGLLGGLLYSTQPFLSRANHKADSITT